MALSRQFLLVLFSIALISHATNGQNISGHGRGCASTSYLDKQIRADPSRGERLLAFEDATRAYIADRMSGRSSARAATVTIPVVFHIIYNANKLTSNISEARIMAQLKQLNEDFLYINSDKSKIPSVFQSVASETNVQFCLASRTPAGAATNGIVRVKTTATSFDASDKMKKTSSGGSDPWDTTKYLNIWSCDLGSGLLGYAQFPGGPAATDGVVILADSIGGMSSKGTATNYDLGRTATHEIGHWLNLYHIWGDATCGNDEVADTPVQSTSNEGCPTFPHVSSNCNQVKANGDMYMNYMDYVNDNCMQMFTAGQALRIEAALVSRSGLATSQGCAASGVTTTKASTTTTKATTTTTKATTTTAKATTTTAKATTTTAKATTTTAKATTTTAKATTTTAKATTTTAKATTTTAKATTTTAKATTTTAKATTTTAKATTTTTKVTTTTTKPTTLASTTTSKATTQATTTKAGTTTTLACNPSLPCSNCTQLSSCGFCSSTGSCLKGNSAGPTGVACTGWAWLATSCPAATTTKATTSSKSTAATTTKLTSSTTISTAATTTKASTTTSGSICTTTYLEDNTFSTYFSCGATGKVVSGSSVTRTLYAVATQSNEAVPKRPLVYRFSFESVDYYFSPVLDSSSSSLQLTSQNAGDFICGYEEYDVWVQVSYDGRTFCDYGPSCRVGITNNNFLCS